MATKAQLSKVLASRVLARRRLLHFTKVTHPSYDAGWVHEDITRRLEKFSRDVANKLSPRLMLLMPPRHGKSELASIRFPAWHLGTNPEHEIINVGYNIDLPMKFSRKIREVMRESGYQAIFPDAVLDPDSQSAENWNTTKGGGFTAAGVGGGITGKGAHILIIDDPIKNQADSDSVSVRDTLWDWYQSTAYTRLAPGGGVLVIETWWNDDDLAGRLQEVMRSDDPHVDQFEIIKYPAIATDWEYRDNSLPNFPIKHSDVEIPTGLLAPTTELLRAKGDPLHLSRYPIESLNRIRATLTPRIWSALYQQNPVPDEGMYFKKEYFKYQQQLPPPQNLKIYTAWDFAISEKSHNDFTVGATLLQDEHDNLYVLEIHRMKGDSFSIIEAMLDVQARWGQIPTTSYLLGVEDGMIWRALAPMFKKRCQERLQYPPIEVLRPLTDKLSRARPLQGRMQQGKVIFPLGASWLPVVENELLRFPAGVHDDVVDALAWAVTLCMGKAPPQFRAPPKMKSWRDKLSIGQNGGSSHMSA